MNEIEVKILKIDVQDVKSKLKKLGAKKIFDGQIEPVTFDFPDARLKKAKQLLRIRKVGNETELCFKGKKQQSALKIQEEIQVNTSNFEETMTILTKIGFIAHRHSPKHRESYSLGNVRFEIDTDPPIPTYLEIEASSEEEVINAVKQLGFKMNQTSNLTGAELHEMHKSRPNI